MAISDMRRQYSMGTLTNKALTDNPLDLFKQWLDEAIAADIPDPTAMTVATVDASGQPSQRIVLLKELTAEGFVFYTNFGSRKAQDLAGNAQVSLHFPWFFMERQISVRGRAEKLPATHNAAYFFSRPLDSQLAAYASRQSQPIENKEALLARFAQLKQQYKEGELPAPEFWGGFLVKPSQIEFWQGGKDRLHDRFEYSLDDEHGWNAQRLMP
ncbi:pyridoxamine 5'-phosphate oxidase [Salinimonas marina]|uniref:Pyridoxine/pyridoxamine 5'-phosphate oxidase n=1 Tax=Salinimonas marina TaxID=2785918 RepID=A0A7S9E047_9ALTE|nr:pyridoxamine 5'-phosphate oxidase [Salinimonas marina]QPG06580.1 pyridoxamine 5'-phosphate oxidase [Salinimonas marina]